MTHQPLRSIDWTPSADSALMGALADGKTYRQAGALVGKSADAAERRFQRLRKLLGWQAT